MKLFHITALTNEGDTLTATADNRDHLRWELRAPREKWPSYTDAPQLWATFLLWSTLARAKELDGQEFEIFADRITAISIEAVDANPTR